MDGLGETFVDRMGLQFEENGASRLMGRIFGHLLVCHPETQSLPQLCAAVGTSKGPASIVTRQLLTMGLIERVHVRGARATHFKVRGGGWMDLMWAKLAGMTEMRRLAEQGLAALANEPPERSERLREFARFYADMEREFALLLERYASTHSGR